LSTADKGVAWAFEKLTEDNLYWGTVYDRWVVTENFNKGPALFFNDVPAVIRPLIKSKVRRDTRGYLKGQGLGRHSQADIHRIAIRGIHAIADQLGDKAYLMGGTPCGADAAVFGCVSSYLCATFDGPMYQAAQARPNLIAYRDRGMHRWYPDFKA
jgi:glutathione S-transferase